MATIFSNEIYVGTNGGGTNSYQFKGVIILNSQNIGANTSNVTVNHYGRKVTSSYSSNANPYSSITVDSNQKVNNQISYITSTTYRLLSTWTGDITHESDGKKTMPFDFRYRPNSSTSYMPVENSIAGDIVLTTIPRATPCPPFDAVIGTATNFILNPASSSFTHVIRYAFGSLIGTFDYNNNQITIPASFYTQMPNSQSDGGSIYCDTYSGGTRIGTTFNSLVARCDANNCKPVITACTLNDINTTTQALTGSTTANPILIKNKSTARIYVNGNTVNSATLSSVLINGQVGIIGNNDIINANASSYTISLVDSRGYTKEYIFSTNTGYDKGYTLINYVNLSLVSNIYRINQTANTMFITYSGNYFNENFSVGNPNTLSLSLKVKEKGTSTYVDIEDTLTIVLSGNVYSNGNTAIQLTNPLIEGGAWDYQKSYDFAITISDLITSPVETQKIVPRGVPDFAIFKDYIVANGIVITQEPWQTPTLLNSWVNYSNGYNDAGYYQANGRVYLRGLIRNGTLNQPAFVLPEGYRPSNVEILTVSSNANYGNMYIQTNGNVIPTAGNANWFSLDGVSFRIA